MQPTQSARKYAQALFAEAQSHNQVRACEQGLQEILRVTLARPSLVGVLSHPFIAPGEKQAVLRSALGEFSTPLLERFLNLLVDKRRLGLLPVIKKAFQDLVDQSQNIQAVTVSTALAMSETQRASLRGHLEGWLKSEVRMTVDVDPQLIGGLVIRTNDKECDQSLRGALQRMRGLIENSI